MKISDSNEISEVSLIEEGLMKYVCPKCYYIFDICDKVVNCPSCGLSNESKYVDFTIYPVLTAIDILYSLHEIDTIAKAKQKSIINNIQNKLNLALNKEFEFNKIKQILIDFCNIMNSSEGMYFDKLRNIVSRTLALSDEDYLDKAYYIFITGDNYNRLYKSMVFLSATLIEIIFKDYMNKLLIKKINSFTSNKIMNSLAYKSLEDHINLINTFLINDLKYEIEKIEPGYFDKWETLRKDRNKLIHKNEIHISSQRADDIFKIAKKSVLIFMELSNRLNVAPT